MYELCGNFVCLFASPSPAPNTPRGFSEPTSRLRFCLTIAYMYSTCVIKNTWIRPQKPERILVCDLFLAECGGLYSTASYCNKNLQVLLDDSPIWPNVFGQLTAHYFLKSYLKVGSTQLNRQFSIECLCMIKCYIIPSLEIRGLNTGPARRCICAQSELQK